MNILIIDLNDNTKIKSSIDLTTLESYLGGRGLGAQYLYKNLKPKIDALSPDNILSFWTSPLIGSGALSMVKVTGMTKSPLTGTILMSLMGGYFGPAMRFAGVDNLVIKGRAKEPIYILLKNGDVEIRSAKHLWGLTTDETEKKLIEEYDNEKIQIASIGPAGENLVLFSSIMHSGHAMGRGGIGAVMGSKYLKAVVALGHNTPNISDSGRFKHIIKNIIGDYKENYALKMFGQTGTTYHVDGLNEKRIYPTHNFQENIFNDYQKINAESLYKNYVKHRHTCYACPVKCRRESATQYKDFGVLTTDGPEYETLWSFGGNCGNSSLESIIIANELCRRYGLDTISTGVVISFAMECFEKGLLSLQDTKGIHLNFGNSKAITEIIPLIANRQGIGNILAQGTHYAAERIGNGAYHFAMNVKGLELPGYDPRGAKGMGLGYATSPRGGCHERGYLLQEVAIDEPKGSRYLTDGKGELVKNTQDMVAVKDALGLCVLASSGTTIQNLAELFSASTGIEMSENRLLEAGERICNVERLFNNREGFTRKDDRLPERLLKEAVLDIDNNPQTVDSEIMLDDYYKARGWDNEGFPMKETLIRLGLV